MNTRLIFLICKLVILSSYLVTGIPPVLRDDEFDSPYDQFTMSVNVLTCPPEIWTHEHSVTFKEVLSNYINYFCATRTVDDYYKCDSLMYSNESMVTSPEDVIFLGGYPKRSFVYWDIQFVVFWRPCYARTCTGIKPFANKNVLANMLFLFSSNISDELGFIIIDFDRDEPFDSTTRLVNVIVLPCGLAVTVIMAGVVWLAVAIEKRSQKIQEEIRMHFLMKKRDSKKNLHSSGTNKVELQWDSSSDADDKIYIIQPGKSNPILLDVTRIKVANRLPANGGFGKVADTMETGETLPNHVPHPNGNISMVVPNAVRQKNATHNNNSKLEDEHGTAKNKWHFIKIYNTNKQNHAQQKRLHEQRHQQQIQQQKKPNAWRGGNILLRPLGKRAAEGPPEPNQYL